MNGLNWGLKVVLALEKERPFLFKEDGKSLIHGNDGLIGFDLRKVRINRGIKSYVWSETELQVEAKIIVRPRIDETSGIQERRIGIELCLGKSRNALAGFRNRQAGN